MESNEKIEYFEYVNRWVYRDYTLMGQLALKRNRCNLYQVSASHRCAMELFLGNRLSRHGHSGNADLLKYSLKPWWMTGNAYQDMLSKLGVDF